MGLTDDSPPGEEHERRLTQAGFILVARNIAKGQHLWERPDEPNRSFLDEEALAWLLEQRQRELAEERKR